MRLRHLFIATALIAAWCAGGRLFFYLNKIDPAKAEVPDYAMAIVFPLMFTMVALICIAALVDATAAIDRFLFPPKKD